MTCCLEPHDPKVESIHCPSRSARQWRIISRRLSNNSSSTRASSSWARRMEACGPAFDYRTLNLAALEELHGACIFSKLDLWSVYNLVRIREANEWKTVFITPSGHYEYQVMPYGLANSPSVFQGFMNEVFQEFLHCFMIVYIDRTSPPRNSGPPATQEIPPLSEASEMRNPPYHHAVPRLCHPPRRDPDGPGEGASHSGVATASIS